MLLKQESLLEGKMRAVMAEEYGRQGKTVCIICKCNSVEEANKKAIASGLGDKWFAPGCCEEVRIEQLCEEYGVSLLGLLEKSDMVVCVDGKNFLSFDNEMRDYLLR